MSPLARWVSIAAVALGLTVAAALAPFGLRRLDAFRVQRVEVTGSHFMDPQDALAATGITDSSSVFDDPDRWAERLRAQRMVAEASVELRLPGTIRIQLIETEPVALLRTPELRPADARGRVLPIDVAGDTLDIPVLTVRSRIGADSVADSASLRLIEGLLAVRAIDPVLGDAISEIGPAHGGGLRLVLSRPLAAEILLPESPDARTLRQVALAMDHLRSEDRTENGNGSTALDRLARIDARYVDELFVSLRSRRTNRE